jgi:hypothetical protein
VPMWAAPTVGVVDPRGLGHPPQGSSTRKRDAAGARRRTGNVSLGLTDTKRVPASARLLSPLGGSLRAPRARPREAVFREVGPTIGGRNFGARQRRVPRMRGRDGGHGGCCARRSPARATYRPINWTSRARWVSRGPVALWRFDFLPGRTRGLRRG